MVPVKAVCIWRMSYLMKSVTLPFPCSDFSLRSFRKGATCSHVSTVLRYICRFSADPCYGLNFNAGAALSYTGYFGRLYATQKALSVS